MQIRLKQFYKSSGPFGNDIYILAKLLTSQIIPSAYLINQKQVGANFNNQIQSRNRKSIVVKSFVINFN